MRQAARRDAQALRPDATGRRGSALGWAPRLSRAPLTSALLALLLQGCSGTAESAASRFYKPTGSLQCSASVSTRRHLDAEVAALEAGGAKVEARSCGVDGKMRPAVCGAPNGDIFLVTLDAAAAPLAQRRGFRPAGEVPQAQVASCD